MPLISTDQPNLVGGVSQQPAELRVAEQCESQENAHATVIEGLHKRPPTEHIGSSSSVPTGDCFFHTINRDPTEQYLVAAANKNIQVYDLLANGSSETIRDMGGDTISLVDDLNYLTTSNPSTDIEMITIADYTIVTNKAIQPKMKADDRTARKPEALIVVRAGNYSTNYKVTGSIGGATENTLTHTTGDAAADPADETEVRTDEIAEAIRTLIDDGATSPWNVTTPPTSAGFNVTREGSVSWLENADGVDFKLRSHDSVSDTNLAVIKDSVQSFSELPGTAPNGYLVEVKGLPDQATVGGATSYFVKFNTKDGIDFGPGEWQETLAPEIEYQPDPTTMPHLLIRMSTGDFVWTAADGTVGSGASSTVTAPTWGEIAAGDQTSNSRPPFIANSDGTDGELIRNVSFFQDRLAILSGESVTLSESGSYFNFFRTTVTDLLDADRINVQAAHRKVNLLNHAVPLGDQLILFSEFSQFSLRGGQDSTLTPANAYITPATEFESLQGPEPIATRRSVFFAGKRGGFSTVRELYDTNSQRAQFEAVDITGQVPSYLEGAVTKMTASPVEDQLVVLTDGATDTLWVYKWFINGGKREQSSWFKFTLGGTGTAIRHAEWIDQELHLTVTRGSQTSFEKMDFQPFYADTNSDFRVHLDRRVADTSNGVSDAYNASTDQTTITLPYDLSSGATYQVMTRESSPTKAGRSYPVVSTGTNTIVIAGNKTTGLGSAYWVGEQYTMRYTFTKLHFKPLNTGRQSVVGGSFRPRKGILSYADSGYFKINVTPDNQTAVSYPMTGNYLSDDGALTGVVTPLSGQFEFPLLGRGDELTIEIENDSPLPSRFLKATWESLYHSRASRM